MCSSDKERLASLETSLGYIMKKLDTIDNKVDNLQAMKFQLLGAAGTIALFISLVGVLVK